MVGFLYLILTIVFGCSLILRVCNVEELYCSINEKVSKLPRYLFVLPSGSVVGILLVTFFNYFLIYALNIVLGLSLDIVYAIAIVTVILLLILFSIINFKYVDRKRFSLKENVYYFKIILFIILVACFLIFYGYFIRDGKLNLGNTVHSDLSPHTALVESFGIGGNIPTMYPHFSNDGIRYHFLFYFYAGILKYLGMRLDLALNIPTIIGIVSGLMLAGLLANLLSSFRKAYFWAPFLILFRSSFDIFDMIKGKPLLTLISRIIHNDMWYRTTPYDEWGLWAINVYANQRHLMFGFAVFMVVLILFIPYVKKTSEKLKNISFVNKIRYLFFNKDSLKISDFKLLILTSLIMMALPYFHASILISLLIVLFVMAIFSTNKLTYLIIAVLSILSSFVQTRIFAGKVSGIVNLKLALGFVMGHVSIIIILKYLLVLTGLTLILGLYYVFKKKNYLIIMAIAFIGLIVFANLCQLSIDNLANHKFIQVAINLFSILVGAFLSEYVVLKGGTLKKILWVIMIFLLTATGISEWFIYINMNKYPSEFDENSPVTLWLKENTNPTDTLLTPYWSMHNEYLSGRQIYYGWPYYAWSAGHDTDNRSKTYFYLLKGCNNNINEFIKICRQEQIKYLIDTAEYFDFEDIGYDGYHREYITDNLTLVKSFPNEGVRIYAIY